MSHTQEAAVIRRLTFRAGLHLQVKDVGDEEEGGVSLVPSAPPAHVSLTSLLEGEGDLLSLEPPVWVPDSHASTCTRCKLPFRCSSSCCAPMAENMSHCITFTYTL